MLIFIILISQNLFYVESMLSGAGVRVCIYGKSHRLLTADCSRRILEELPSSIKFDVEVLDLSQNYITELYNDSFKPYKSIVNLYLQDNHLSVIEPGALTHLSLVVLDLSRNKHLRTLPELPQTLERLYLNGVKSLTPDLPFGTLTRLQVLSLGSCGLKKFPTFRGYLPSLVELNVTNNKFTELSVEDLAPLCQLKFLRTDVLFSRKEQSCDCLKLKNWIMTNGVRMDSLSCEYDANPVECDASVRNDTMLIYEACSDYKKRLVMIRVIIVGAVSVCTCLACVLAFFVCRRRKRRRRLAKKNSLIIGLKSTSTDRAEKNHRTQKKKQDDDVS